MIKFYVELCERYVGVFIMKSNTHVRTRLSAHSSISIFPFSLHTYARTSTYAYTHTREIVSNVNGAYLPFNGIYYTQLIATCI